MAFFTDSSLDRRDFLRLSGLAGLSVTALGLVGCGGDPTATAEEAVSGSSEPLRIGMEAAYAPYNWQVSSPSEYTIPIENVAGAYADGYDVQIAKVVGEELGREPVAVKLSWSGLIDALNNGQIDLIIAGMSETPERAESIDFSDSYLDQKYGLFVLEGSPYQDATSLEDFSGASVLGQKDTMLDDVIDDIPNVNHLNPVESVPNVFSHLMQGTCDAVTYNIENEKGYMDANPGIVPIRFEEGKGFLEVVGTNVGIKKGNAETLAQINDALDGLSDVERQEIFEAVLERQPE